MYVIFLELGSFAAYPQGYRREKKGQNRGKATFWFLSPQRVVGSGKSPVSRRKTLCADVYQNIPHDCLLCILRRNCLYSSVFVEQLSYRSISDISYRTDSRVTASLPKHIAILGADILDD